jgi:hypothetical protein
MEYVSIFKVLSRYLDARIRIRIKVTSRIRIRNTEDKLRYILYYPFVTFQVPLITTPSLQQPIMMASTLEPSGLKKS